MARIFTYAIGDVHGRADLLKALLAHCVADARSKGGDARFIFIGDICDKGPSTREAYDTVAEVLTSYPGSVLIKGNHDDMFERSVGRHQRNAVAAWLQRGGVQALNSYVPNDLESAIRVAGSLHADHVRMIEESALMVVEDGFVYSHAGINPEKSIEDQNERDLMWLREPFMGHVGDLGFIAIHGHTVVGERPVVTENRISIDTGAYSTGRLTAVRVSKDGIAFFQTDGDASSVVAVDPVLEDRGMGTVMDRLGSDRYVDRIAA